MQEAATAVLEPPIHDEETKKGKPKTAKPWAVIVMNDDEHTYEYVITLLMKVIPCQAEKAFQLAEQIDKAGRTIIWSGSQEVAELKRDQIKSGGKDFFATAGPVAYPLGCYIEEMP